MTKTSSVSARIDPEVCTRLELSGVNVSNVINKALIEASWSLETMEQEYDKRKKELSEMKLRINRIKKERIKLDNELTIFFMESKKIIRNNPEIINGRIKLLYGLFKIPVDKNEFIKLMNNYLKKQKNL